MNWIRETMRTELEHLRHRRGWMLLCGIITMIAGVTALGAPYLATMASVMLIGAAVFVGGVAQILLAVAAPSWRGASLHLLAGVLAAIVAIVLLVRPDRGAEVLTLTIAVLLLAGGSMRIAGSAFARFAGWGWSLANGVVSALLGLFLFAEWPASGLWFIGIYAGIDLLLLGFMWIGLALVLQRVASQDHFRERPSAA